MRYIGHGHPPPAMRRRAGELLANLIVSTIELRGISKGYDGRCVIDRMSLKVEKAERVVLFGPSGCGKTTVLHLIAGLTTPDAGEILIGEEVVANAERNMR